PFRTSPSPRRGRRGRDDGARRGVCTLPEVEARAPEQLGRPSLGIEAVYSRRQSEGSRSDVGEHAVQRPRHLGEIQRIDEQPRVADLPSAAAPHETSKLFLGGPSLPRGLLLEGAEGSEITLSRDDLFHRRRTEGADQLVLQVRDADVETQSLHIDATEVGAETGPLEPAPEVALLCGVAETRQPDV